jgi:hypothetical protein
MEMYCAMHRKLIFAFPPTKTFLLTQMCHTIITGKQANIKKETLVPQAAVSGKSRGKTRRPKAVSMLEAS